MTSTDSHAHTLILGVGSPLMGDDAAGVLAVQAIQARADLPPGVDVFDGGTDGFGLIPVIEAYSRVIVVDAAQLDLPPGSFQRFTWGDVRLAAQTHTLSLHQGGLPDALLLAEVLGSLPAELVFYGIQPEQVAWDAPLSEAVAQALPALVEAILREARTG
ncbi:MAG TPA: hydrogenase maturation protease [Aggregatilinea sp.]|uniref:hydrogenase maturation protease n=1 Tax=Aggregatilinea sp. TaxID=2806333 RepID=UPI002C97BFA5|nr:hydrogenase maturation protease [Aggregatilinea sp.]HML21140.1 hydrogenase maturation protease [Aggregatilinea sp.]